MVNGHRVNLAFLCTREGWDYKYERKISWIICNNWRIIFLGPCLLSWMNVLHPYQLISKSFCTADVKSSDPPHHRIASHAVDDLYSITYKMGQKSTYSKIAPILMKIHAIIVTSDMGRFCLSRSPRFVRIFEFYISLLIRLCWFDWPILAQRYRSTKTKLNVTLKTLARLFIRHRRYWRSCSNKIKPPIT